MTARLRAALRACLAAVLALAAACADSPSVPVQPVPAGETPATAVRLVCTASVTSRAVSCEAPGGALGGPRADRIYGAGTGMKLTSSNIAIVADSFMFDVTVTNNLEFPVGTTDGVNADPNGIRVFFVDGINTTSGTGAVTVANADGVDVFTATGQAYFAYHGILQPAATTAAKRWKLRFDPGVATFSFALYISTPVPPGGGRIFMHFNEPPRNGVVGDSVRVVAVLDSASAPIQSIRATVQDRTVMLAKVPAAPGYYAGTLWLTGLFGPQQLLIHAVTIRADTSDFVVPFVKDQKPVMTVRAPRASYVASPTLRIDVDCVDDNPAGCASITATRVGDASPLASGGAAGIHTDVSLAAYEEQTVAIQFRAADSRNQAVTRTDTVYVETEAALVRVDSGGRTAMDLDSTRLLFGDATRGVWMNDRGAGTRTQLTGSTTAPAAFTPSGWLHPQGALFTGGAGATVHVYDWRSGALSDLGTTAYNLVGLVAKGNWGLFSLNSSLVRRDLGAGTSATITSGFAAGYHDVGDNGDVAFTDPSLDIQRYRGGVYTQITADADNVRNNFNPVTDGTNILWIKTNPFHPQTQFNNLGPIYISDGGPEAALTAFDVNRFDPNLYGANGGWIAYPMKDGTGIWQVATRAPDGTVRQATSTAFNSTFVSLGPDGTLVYSTSGALWVRRAPYTAPATRLGRNWLRTRWRGAELQVYLGNTAFRPTY